MMVLWKLLCTNCALCQQGSLFRCIAFSACSLGVLSWYVYVIARTEQAKRHRRDRDAEKPKYKPKPKPKREPENKRLPATDLDLVVVCLRASCCLESARENHESSRLVVALLFC